MLRIIMEYFPPPDSRVIVTPNSRQIWELGKRQHAVFSQKERPVMFCKVSRRIFQSGLQDGTPARCGAYAQLREIADQMSRI